jgi:hypothetical protein
VLVPASEASVPALVATAVLARRAVATPAALDGATYPPDALVLRLAPDDVLVIGGGTLTIDDSHAIVEDEHGFVSLTFSWAEYEVTVAPFVDWSLPLQRPALAQGYVAGIPAKLWLEANRVLLLTSAAYADELVGRLS